MVYRLARYLIKDLRCVVQGIIDNQRKEDPNTDLEEENRRLLAFVAELRQKMSDMHEEFAATTERLNGQVTVSL